MAPAVSPPWTGIVLAGGQSSRMGRDKAALPWRDGQSLLEHARQQLQSAGAARVVVSGPQADGDAVPDREAGQGPLAALAQLLPQLADGTLIIVPVDMPLLSAAALHPLVAVDAACAAYADHPLPMRLRVDLPTRTTLARLDELPPAQRSLRLLQRELQATLLDPLPWRAQLRGCNTPDEWKALLAAADYPASDGSN